SSAMVSDPAVQGTSDYFKMDAFENADSGLQVLADFTDPGGAEGVSNYSATITWGDGTSSAGVITYDANTRLFKVSGRHTYAEETIYVLNVRVFHDQADFTDLISFAAVVDQSMAGIGDFLVTGTEGADTGLQTVATFTDPAGPERLSDYS